MDEQNALPANEPEKKVGIFEKIKNSIYGPDYYQELLKKESFYSWGYFFKFSLIVGVVSAFAFSIFAVPSMNSALNEIVSQAQSKYPSELEVKIQKGIVSTNVEEPYMIPMPKDIKNDGNSDKSVQNFLVIDTKNDFSVSKFNEYDAAVWLMKDSVVYYNNSEISVKSLSEVSDFTINKSLIDELALKISPYLKYVSLFIAFFIFVGLFFVAFFKALYLIFGALVIWLVLKIKKVEVGYKKSYMLGLHLMTLPTLIFLIPGNNWKFKFSYTIVLAIITWINFSGPQKVKSEEPEAEKIEEIASEPVPAISQN